MIIKHINEVKQQLGEKSLAVLTDIFRKSTGIPPWVVCDRYRADHPKWLGILDRLDRSVFLKRDSKNRRYIVTVYALPLLEDDLAQNLMNGMEKIFFFFKTEYQQRLSKPLALSTIFEALNLEQDLVRKALSYMKQSNSIWSGLSNDFPLKNDSTLCISEEVLRYESFGEIVSQFYEWHIVNPHNSAKGNHIPLDEEQQYSDGFFTPDDLCEKPNWFEKLDDQKKTLIGEIDKALKYGLIALPTMGLRTLFDLVLVEHVGDKGTFNNKIDSFEKKGVVTRQQREFIEKVIEAGHATTHRAYFPTREDLQTCVDVTKHIMQGVYELHPRAKMLKNNTPKRPKDTKTTQRYKGEDKEKEIAKNKGFERV